MHRNNSEYLIQLLLGLTLIIGALMWALNVGGGNVRGIQSPQPIEMRD